MEEKYLKMIEEAKRLHGNDIVLCNPAFTVEQDLNKLIFWFSTKLDNGKLTTRILTTNLKGE